MPRRRPPRGRLRRYGPTRDVAERVLIVCGGEKTEPSYFRSLADEYRLHTADVRIVQTPFDPKRLVAEAKVLSKREQKRGEQYDKVYCVFDHDEHAGFDAASKSARDAGVEPVRSWPCFEFWFLLHFGYTRKAYTRTGTRTPCENCIRDLQVRLPGYGKTDTKHYDMLRDRLDQAKANARQALEDAHRTGEFNPSTEVHVLVDVLQRLVREAADGGAPVSRTR